jgi:hypothetical protein
MYLTRFLLLCSLLSGILACQTSDHHPDVSHIQVQVPLERLENELFACGSVEAVQAFLTKYPYLAQLYFPDAPADDAQLATALYNNIRNPALQGFKQQLDSLFNTTANELSPALEDAFRYFKHYYPDFNPPRVVTLVTGFLGSDLYVSDSLIVIGLDYFGGPQAQYRPQVYDYQLHRYQPAAMVPSILFFLSDKYNRIDPNDRTLLADMIGYGKAFEFVKHMAPQTPDSLILGFSERDLNRTYNSQTELWAFLVENKLLYESSELKKQKYVGERPFTPEIGPEVPGGIGRWIGWRIVSRYLAEHPEVSLPELMTKANARQLLQESGYKGQLD